MICAREGCGKEFEPRDPRQQCCTKACGAHHYQEKNRAARNGKGKDRYWGKRDQIRAAANARYRTDPEYRAIYVDYMRARRSTDPESVRAINRKYIAKPENREHARVKASEWHQENKEYANPLRGDRYQKMRNQTPWCATVRAAKSRAKQKAIPFDLTDEWAKARWTGRCEMTEIEFTIGLRGSGAKLFSASIDKIVPALGYVQGNCRFVIWCINAFKYDGTDEQMIATARALIACQDALMSKTAQHGGEVPLRLPMLQAAE